MFENKKNKIKEKEKGVVDFLLAFIRRDFFTIILCLLVLTACAYTIGRSADIQNKCNERWIRQLGLDQEGQESYKFPDLKGINISSYPKAIAT